MPGGIQVLESSSVHSFFGGNITAAVNNGTLSEERLDDMCRRIMTPYYYLGQSSLPPVDGEAYDLHWFDGMSGLRIRSRSGDADLE